METTIRTRIKHKHGRSSEWSSKIDFIPLNGELIIYDDHKTQMQEDGSIVELPGIKIGNGVDNVITLPFVNEALEQQILNHINDTSVHLQNGERQAWNENVTAYVIDADELAVFE